MKTLTMEELYVRSKNLPSDEIIVDIRTPEEFADGHVPKSRNISHEQIGEFAEELKKYKKFYMYCRSGGRVSYASQELMMRGLTNFESVVSGGMPNWTAMGYPEER